MAAYHLVARIRGKFPLLDEFVFASRVWSGLRRAFPVALSATLMPEHAHVVADGDDPDWMRRRMARALASSARGRGRGVWDPVPEPDLVREPKLARALRYVALNPCRRGLVGDPLVWFWSTFRDMYGATAEPWIDPGRLARRLGWKTDGFVRRFHDYVTADHTVAVDGTPFPRPAVGQLLPCQSLDALVLAVSASLRSHPRILWRRGPARRMFVALAGNQAWRDTKALAACCRITPRAIRYLHEGGNDTPIASALVCLGDGRFTEALTSFPSLLPRSNDTLLSSPRKIVVPRATVPVASSPWWKIGRRWLGLG